MSLTLPISDRAWNKVVVYGLGASGMAASRLLRAHGVEVWACDRRAEVALAELADDPGVTIMLGIDPDTLPESIDAVVTSPGVPADRPLFTLAREAGIPVVAEVELAYHLLDGPVIGITGSNGKSTVTALTTTMLRAAGHDAASCGNFGEPLAAHALGPTGRTFVVELSSFQLETIEAFRPHAAAVLNLSPDHLDRHGSLEAYKAAKARILHQQTATDIAILNADDPWVVALETPGHRRLFSLRGPVADGCYLDDAHVVEITAEGERVELFATADMHIEGRHNLANAMAAALLARSQGVEPEAIVRGLAAFDGLPHRLERVAEIGGVVYWDDSKGTNVGATIGSLAGFEDGTVHVILGGDPKDQDFAPLAPVVAAKARAVYLIGEAAPALAEVLDDSTDILQVETLDRAVSAASRVARSGEAVVLSPACASFDQFRNFIARGRAFQALVRELQHGGTHGA